MSVTEASPTPVEQGSTTGGAEGAGTQTATTEEKLLTQAQVDEIVKARLAEQKTKLTSRFEADAAEKIKAALAERETQIEATIAERVNAALNDKALADTRTVIQGEYSLSEAQLARLTGSTPDELKADAETLFGALKAGAQGQQRKPPVLHAGDAPNAATDIDLSNMSAAEIRERSGEIWAKLGKKS